MNKEKENKPIVIKCADIYLRFPELMKEELDELIEFLNDEHIVYEGATKEFKELQQKEVVRENKILRKVREELKEENENIIKRNKSLNKRLKHLLQSKTIQKFDEINPINKEYKLDIKNLDKIITSITYEENLTKNKIYNLLCDVDSSIMKKEYRFAIRRIRELKSLLKNKED